MGYKDLLANDDEFKKEKRSRTIFGLILTLAVLAIGVTTFLVVRYNNRDKDMHGEFTADSVNDDGIVSASGKDNDKSDEDMDAEVKFGDDELIYIQALSDIDKDHYDKVIDAARDARSKKGPLNGYDLCKILAAISYHYDWDDQMPMDATKSVNEFMRSNNMFTNKFTAIDAALYYKTNKAMFEGGFDKAFNQTLFGEYVDPMPFNGSSLTFNDFLYTMYDWYYRSIKSDNEATYKGNSFLLYLQDKKNILISPTKYMSYYHDLELYDAMYWAYYANNKGYTFGHLLEIVPSEFVRIGNDDGIITSQVVEAKYAVPVVLYAGIEYNEGQASFVETKQSKEVMVCLLDEQYEVVSFFPYNYDVDAFEDLDEEDVKMNDILQYQLIDKAAVMAEYEPTIPQGQAETTETVDEVDEEAVADEETEVQSE